MKYLFRTICVFCVGILLLSTGIASAQDLTIGNYSLVSKSRVSRTEYNYIYQADITNTGSEVQNVTATLTSNSSHTIVVAGTLSFGDVPSGATVTSSDTFTIKQNRRYPLDWSDLVWDIQYESGVQPLRIKNITPDAGLPGAIVTVTFSGNTNSEPLLAVLGSQVLDTVPVAGRTDAVTFQVAAGAKSAPLYLMQGDCSSNSVWFSVSDIYVVTPAPEDIVLDELGNEVAVNLVLMSMKDGFETVDEAQRVSNLVNGIIVGRIPLISAYQVRLTTTSLEELRATIERIKADPAVRYVMEDQKMGNDDVVDWSKDPCLFNQRVSNAVEKGAELYSTMVDPVDPGKIHPIFTSIGIVEAGVDFDAADFDGYEKGTDRPNNIAIYADDVIGDDTHEEHGTTVTGMVAAEIGDGGETTGQNAGLLQGLGESHGGFNIRVQQNSPVDDSGTAWASSVIATTNSMLEHGATVINWSFGGHKKGAIQSDGNPVTSNIITENFFTTAKEVFEHFFDKMESEYPHAVIVATAGNGNTLVDPDFRLPSAIDSDSMIVVGAHVYDPVLERASYSNYGDRVDIVAAGTVKISNGKATETVDGKTITVNKGTSFAAPLVTATIAAMKSVNPDLTGKEVRHLLRSSARLLVVNTVDTPSGPVTVTAPLTSAEVGDDTLLLGKAAKLMVRDAIQAAIDSLGAKTVPKGDPVEVELKFGAGDVTKSIEVTVPSEDVFDKVDILFLVDVSGSYGDDITQFKNKAVDLVDAFQDAGKNVQTGVATFSDFPISPYGSASSGDYAYMLNQPLTADPAAAIAAINGISLHYGADGPESQLEALYQAATGAGRSVAGHPDADIAPSPVGWRSGSFPIIFLATDAGFHNSDSETGYPGAGRAQTLSDLTSRGIRIYGLQSGGRISDVVSIVADTGGESFTLSRNSAEIVDAVVAALEGASSSVDIRLVPNGDFAELIQSITPEDGYQDVMSGETRTFDVTFSRHLWKRDPTADHIFALRLEVVAEGVAVIMEIPVTVHVKFR